MDIRNNLTFIPRLLGVGDHPKLGMWLLYVMVLCLCAAVYKLGFAKKLPPLKSAIVYLMLALFCTVLTFLAVLMPIAEGLVVLLLIFGIYKVRFRLEHQK